jgi:hypothetical protein
MKRKYNCNDNFFSEDNELSFYVAGFIAADGCIRQNKGCSKISDIGIRLSKNDREHLENINNALETDRPIKDYKNKYSGVSVLKITSDKMCQDLFEKFNITPRKSNTYIFPNFVKQHELVNHFMRGYFDGDGSFYIQKQSNEKVCFGLRGTESFLTDYRSILERQCDFSIRHNKMPVSGGCCQLAYGGNRNIIKISNFLYNDATIFLNRKKEVALKANQLVGNLYSYA